MTKPQYHILVCSSVRGSEPKGVCHAKGAQGLLPYLESELADRGIDALVSSTSCLKVCDNGPAIVIYPQGDWYGSANEEAIDEILDALAEGGRAEGHLL